MRRAEEEPAIEASATPDVVRVTVIDGLGHTMIFWLSVDEARALAARLNYAAAHAQAGESTGPGLEDARCKAAGCRKLRWCREGWCIKHHPPGPCADFTESGQSGHSIPAAAAGSSTGPELKKGSE